jgi:electron transport complex protein RnfD
MTTWNAVRGSEEGFFSIYASNLATPFMQSTSDAVSSATPLGLMKFEHIDTSFWQLFMGNTSGSLGETSGILLLVGGIYLLVRKSIDWRIPTSIFLSAGTFALILFLVDSNSYPNPFSAIFSGGLLLGTFFMATDPATSPITPKGTWIFGIGIGILVILIRMFGGFPEGMMYAILLMNACMPLINRYTQPVPFGRKSKK